MKRLLLYLILLVNILLLLLLSGCHIPSTSSDVSDCTTKAEHTQATTEASTPESTSDKIVYYNKQAKLTSESIEDTVTVYTYNEQSVVYATPVYIDAKMNNRTVTYELGPWDKRVFKNGGGLFIADVDGNGTDEMILFMEITGNGGALAQIFAVKDDKITLLYDLNDLPVELTHTYQDGYVLLLENTSVGFACSIDVSKQFDPTYFDENGRLAKERENNVYTRPISSGTVESTKEGVLPTITCSRYVQLSSVLGTLQTTFRYDKEKEMLVLVAAEFEEFKKEETGSLS